MIVAGSAGQRTSLEGLSDTRRSGMRSEYVVPKPLRARASDAPTLSRSSGSKNAAGGAFLNGGSARPARPSGGALGMDGTVTPALDHPLFEGVSRSRRT